MGLQKKFNLVLITCLLLGFSVIFWFYKNTVVLKTEMNLTRQAEITFQITESIRSYNQNEVVPLLNDLDQGFVPQSVGSYAASQVMAEVNKTVPSLVYKVAIDQSKIKLYQPNIWQQDLISRFQSQPNLPLITDTVADADGRYLVYAKPISNDNQVIGIKSIRINETDLSQQVAGHLRNFAYVLLGSLVLIILILNVIMSKLVISPIKQLAKQTQSISQGQSEAEELELTGTDEVNQIALSFNRMQRSLKAAMGMLS